MVFIRVQEDVIHDLVEYMIPISRTYFSVRVGRFMGSDDLFYGGNDIFYEIYYKDLQNSHYRVYCKYIHDRKYFLDDSVQQPLFLEFHPDIELRTSNPHPKAVKKWIEEEQYSSSNIHPKIIEKCIEYDSILFFPENPSDLVIDFLLKHPSYIDWESFLQNTNPRAVDHCIRMWDEIPQDDKEFFSNNWSQKAVDWLIQNPQFISNDDNYLFFNPFNYNYNKIKYIKSKRLIVDTIQVNP